MELSHGKGEHMLPKFKTVILEEVRENVLSVRMEDRENKNTFSYELINDLKDTFKFINENNTFKAAVLTGFGNYFAAGGTKEGLLKLQRDEIKFTDMDIYRLPFDCKIPVVAAMQGHAIGGGFVLGMFCDFVVMSRESIYTTNFMKYGFTPGMGATCIIPHKLGISLAQEMLLNGANFRGAELEQRGIPFKVLPRSEVYDYSLSLAESVAEKSRKALIILKEHLLRNIKAEISAVIEKELVMHSETIHEEEVASRIKNYFGQ